MQRKEQFIIWSLALYFGWILSFPYFGEVLKKLSIVLDIDYSPLILAFLFFHALGYLVGALFLKKPGHWQILMYGSLSAIILLGAILWFLPNHLWVAVMAIIGFCSPFYILGWSCLISTYPSSQKVKLYLNFIIRANLITVLLIYLSDMLTPAVLYFTKMIPLLIALGVLIKLMPSRDAAISTEKETGYQLPASFIIIIVLFISLLNLTLGLVYTVINSSYQVILGNQFIMKYYGFIPYFLPYVVILNLKREIKLKYLIYTSVSLVGLAYVFLVFLGDNILGFYLTITIIQVGYALVAFFVWLLIGNLSTRYATPFRYFGFGLFALVVGSFFGGAFGNYLLNSGDSPQLITALSALAAIFVALVFTPWLIEKSEEQPTNIDQNNYRLLSSDQEYLEEFYLRGALTDREIEVVELLMKGYTNNTVAENLCISENTLKTHLRRIYRKYNVHKKSELLALITTKSFPDNNSSV
ncbi:MAG: LuxR C-terminal-related transcriptional regulator [Bacillota bacterium]|nr:LuxR C-terminal-related transcriptional regulator [Bacillota bacterium]